MGKRLPFYEVCGPRYRWQNMGIQKDLIELSRTLKRSTAGHNGGLQLVFLNYRRVSEYGLSCCVRSGKGNDIRYIDKNGMILPQVAAWESRTTAVRQLNE